MRPLSAADVESLERATLAAVPPQAQEEVDGWLLGLDSGTVGRSHSAVPLRHEVPSPDIVALIDNRYRARGLAPLLRIPRLACYDGLQRELRQAAWRPDKPTLTQTGTPEALARLASLTGDVILQASPDAVWAGAFLGTGFDPVDGASRIAILGRAQGAVFASVRRGSHAVAVGVAWFAHGWMGVHGMRTAPPSRGRGFAPQILAALGFESARRGVGRIFLQVEQPNVAAQPLYTRAGFTTARSYEYWGLRLKARPGST